MAIEQTLVLIKPDAGKRLLTGLAIDRIEAAGLNLVGAKVVSVSEELARTHYAEHEGKPFFPRLIQYIQGKLHGIPDGRILALAFQGEGAVARVRKVAGATNPEDAEPGTLRGTFGRLRSVREGDPDGGGVVKPGDQLMENVIHAAGNPADAEREIKLWFSPGELVRPIYPVKRVRSTIDGRESETEAWA